ncbi:uncharacterized protein LOC111861324 isoform X3 [Cryptotermes secundus]|uniref:uncharacterized protein LOC111861324 isoform X3 n=1 Tax=Cryptotermes secundus TaxID=105785 RepID=UPI000CD7BC75|nr:uncharacterized protein LOC111861324 isoform X3 [Cryptotermes secundus]
MLHGKEGNEWMLATGKLSNKRIPKHVGKLEKYLARYVGRLMAEVTSRLVYQQYFQNVFLANGESDVHKQDGDRVSTVNTDCSNSKPESTPSMEDNKSEKKRELATALPDTSVYFKEMSVGNNLGMLKLEPDSDKEAHVVPINTESEFIDIKQKGTPEFQSLKKDIDGDNGVDVTSSLRKGGGDEDASHVDNFPT